MIWTLTDKNSSKVPQNLRVATGSDNFATIKPDDQNVIPGTHKVEGESQLP